MILKDKVALITGSNRGIGKCIAETFARNGVRLILNARKKDSLEQLANDIQQQYQTDVLTVYFDVSQPDYVKKGFSYIFKHFKKLDILVNNAGLLQDATLYMVSEELIKALFETNTFGVIYCSQYAARMMMRNQSGSIINIGSIVGTNGNEGQTVYSGTKAAIGGMTKSMAKELAPFNIRVNAINPGLIDTEMLKSIPEEKLNELFRAIKMKRIGSPQDIANVALFLASDLSSYVSGQNIGVDGGMFI